MDRDIKSLQDRYYKILKKNNYSFHRKDNSNKKLNSGISIEKIPQLSLIAYPDLDAKKLQNRFNTFFSDDLYGKYRDVNNLVLSSGSFSAEEFPLCNALRYPIDFALLKNWYGYSDSLGHLEARKAIADMMQLRMPLYNLETASIALINGVTNGLTTILRTLKSIIGQEFHILTHLPTYSPFYSSCNSIALIDTIMLDDGCINVQQFKNAIIPETKIILLLGDLNPMGQMVSISDLNTLIKECTQRHIWLVFDEAGAVYPEYDYHDLIPSPYFILLNSDSKKLGVPGFKTGFLVASKEIVNAFYAEASMSYGSPASIFYLFQEFHARFEQFSLMKLTVLNRQQLALFRSDYELTLPFLQLLYHDYLSTYNRYSVKLLKKRFWVVNQLNQLPKHLVSQVLVPQTGVNLSIHIYQWNDSYEFFLKLLKETKVSVFPGKCSGIDSGCWIRISYALPDEQLHEGIQRVIRFIKKNDVYSKCKNTALYRRYLIEMGHYARYKWLNFWRHIDDVYQSMKKIYLIKAETISSKANTLFEKLSYLHDCGKVISVRLAAVHRIWKNQIQNINDWNRFTDIELLGLKKDLLDGKTFSIDDLLKMVSEDYLYFDLIDFNKNYSPNNEDIRKRMFELYEDNDEAIKLLKRPIPILSNKSSFEDIAVALLDISDKCSDYLFGNEISVSTLFKSLYKKEKYVCNRYGSDQATNFQIHLEFNISRHNLNTFLFNKQLNH